MRRQLSSWYSTIAVLTMVILASSEASALQPLADFLAGARRASVDNREATLAALEQQEQALAALGRTLPSAALRGTYTRNEYQAQIMFNGMKLTLQPFDQWDLFLQVDAPLVDLGGWTRARSARRASEAAAAGVRATVLEVEKQVARQYFTLVGLSALRGSVERTFEAARTNAELTRERRSGGVATALDVERAQAEVERARQSIADVEL